MPARFHSLPLRSGEVLGMGCSLVNCSGQLFIRHMVVLPAAKLDEREVGLAWSSPEPFETATRDPGVVDSVLRIAVPKVILDEPQIVAAIGQVEAA